MADALQNNVVMFLLSPLLPYVYLHIFKQALTTLHIRNNQIGDKGTQHLASALRYNKVLFSHASYLSYLHLHFCSQTLTTLCLQYNKIGDKGFEDLSDALKNNTVSLVLSLDPADISIYAFSHRR